MIAESPQECDLPVLIKMSSQTTTFAIVHSFATYRLQQQRPLSKFGRMPSFQLSFMSAKLILTPVPRPLQQLPTSCYVSVKRTHWLSSASLPSSSVSTWSQLRIISFMNKAIHEYNRTSTSRYDIILQVLSQNSLNKLHTDTNQIFHQEYNHTS